MNKVILIGNLASDPELKKTPSDISCCTFRLAVQRRYQNAQGVREADFLSIVTWRQTAELCAKYLTKGRKCGVVGSIQVRTYDAQDGTKKYFTEIVADEVEFLSSPTQRDGGAYMPPDAPPPEPPAHFSAPAANAGGAGNTGFKQVDDDDLPF